MVVVGQITLVWGSFRWEGSCLRSLNLLFFVVVFLFLIFPSLPLPILLPSLLCVY